MTRKTQRFVFASILSFVLILLALQGLLLLNLQLECKFFGVQKNEQLYSTAEELYKAKADYEAVREALGDPVENGQLAERRAWTYRGCYGLSVILWFDIETGEVVDIGAVIP